MTILGTTATDTTRGVPGVPLQALDAIQDENARLVIRAIVDGWHVRNGNTGNADRAFVTRGEIDGLVAARTKQAFTSFEQTGGSSRRLTAGEINRAINDLQAQIMETQLYKDLEARVDLIDAPGGIFDRLDANELAIQNETTQRIDGDTGLSTQITALGTRIGTAEAGLLTETTQRVNADNALQTTISTQYAAVNDSLALQQQSITTNANSVAALTTQYNQIQASVGDLSAALATETQVRANADGDLYAQYTLRVDVGGRVSGFGLASTSASSDFAIRADRFYIASPGVGEVTSQMPFIVTTTAQTLPNGTVVPAGVYIKSAFIANGAIGSAQIADAAITSAKIGTAAIETAKIADLSITKIKLSPEAFTTGSVFVGNNGQTTYVHNFGHTPILTMWSFEGVPALVSADPYTVTFRLDFSGGGTLYFSML